MDGGRCSYWTKLKNSCFHHSLGICFLLNHSLKWWFPWWSGPLFSIEPDLKLRVSTVVGAFTSYWAIFKNTCFHGGRELLFSIELGLQYVFPWWSGLLFSIEPYLKILDSMECGGLCFYWPRLEVHVSIVAGAMVAWVFGFYWTIFKNTCFHGVCGPLFSNLTRV